MRTHRTWLAAVAVGLMSISSAPGQENLPLPKENPATPSSSNGMVVIQDNCPSSSPSRWLVRGEWVYLQRDTPRVQLAFDDADLTGIITVNDQITFDNEHGGRFTLGRQDDQGSGWEIIYMGLLDWGESDTRAAASGRGFRTTFNNVFLPGNNQLFPFDGGRVYLQDYSSELHSAEANLRFGLATRENLRFAFLLGFRYLKVEEEYVWTAIGTDNGLVGGNPATGVYQAVTDNNLFGLQAGGDLLLDVTPQLGLAFQAKGGVFLNSAEQQSSITGASRPIPANPTPFSAVGEGSAEVTAGLVEFAVAVQYRLGDNIRLTAGYHALFIYSLALAPRQLNFSLAADAQSGLNYRGSTVYHGPTAGIEFSW